MEHTLPPPDLVQHTLLNGTELQEVLDCIDAPADVATSRPERAVYCNRTLNLRSIKCIGYDLDYTLLH